MNSLLFNETIGGNGIQETTNLSHQRKVIVPPPIVRQMEGNPLLNGLMPLGIGVISGSNGCVIEPAREIHAPMFIYCLKGSGWCEASGRRHEINAGDLFVARSGNVGCHVAKANQPGIFFWFYATGRDVRSFLDKLRIVSDGSVINLGDHPQIPALFEDTLDSLEHDCSLAQLVQTSRHLSCLINFIISRSSANWCQPDLQEKITYCVDYLRNHLDKPLRLNAVAVVANLSPSYFNVLFRKTTGQTCMEYLTRLRMDQAREWLCATDWPVKAIAARLAYEDPLYFSKVFSSIYGLSPKKYRQIYREKSAEHQNSRKNFLPGIPMEPAEASAFYATAECYNG